MPSKLYLRGINEAVWLEDSPGDIVFEIEGAQGNRTQDFLRLEMVPVAPGESSRPVFIKPQEVAAVAPLDEREIRAEYADLPDWLEQP